MTPADESPSQLTLETLVEAGAGPDYSIIETIE